ncbi:MAG: hypothetical protein FP819_26570 [Rhizobiaceae bacterium]|nr:hypothetical protein [Rhizobiaceae bacterium]
MRSHLRVRASVVRPPHVEVLCRRPSLDASGLTPLCPAGHLPLKGGRSAPRCRPAHRQPHKTRPPTTRRRPINHILRHPPILSQPTHPQPPHQRSVRPAMRPAGDLPP